jgi:signal transduction histidine kinase/ActR/RegA family two-component response regulator
MAGDVSTVTHSAVDLLFDRLRVADFLDTLECMAAGDTHRRLPISPQHDELDAIAYCINVLVSELAWTSAQMVELHEHRAAELRDAVARAEGANASKSVFVRNVSHEVRTPIAAMLGIAELIASSELPPAERVDLIKRLQANGHAVLELLGKSLDLARLDADQVALAPESISVVDVVTDVLASLEIETRAKGLYLRTEIGSDALTPIRTDRHRLRQILVNLLANAIKFTETGGIRVSLRSMRTAGEELRIIDVSDSGIGIAPDRQKQLFEPFRQADSSISNVYGGTGLGLALSKRLAEKLQGTLTLLQSTPGAGSTFRLTVKDLARATEPEAAGAFADAGYSEEDLKGLRVLLAEDHPDIRLAVTRLLEQAGVTVEAAVDGIEAVAKARAATFDVVLMDLVMPGMSGIAAVRAIRNEGNQIPILALTADAATTRRSEAIDAGCNECLSKPFTLAELVDSIHFIRSSTGRGGIEKTPVGQHTATV